MQFLAVKTGLLVDVLSVCLTLLVVVFGRRYGAGWRSHVQRILIGFSTASLSQMSAQAIWQVIARHTTPHSQAEYQRVVGIQDKLLNANSAVYVLVLIWWIVCLWIDEPGSANTAVVAADSVPAEASSAAETSDA
jgi:membrane protein required for beta-lactamase induction